jgi:hypothetical protein
MEGQLVKNTPWDGIFWLKPGNNRAHYRAYFAACHRIGGNRGFRIQAKAIADQFSSSAHSSLGPKPIGFDIAAIGAHPVAFEVGGHAGGIALDLSREAVPAAVVLGTTIGDLHFSRALQPSIACHGGGHG